MSITKLSAKQFWDNSYGGQAGNKSYPNPLLHRFHFGLDRIFRKYLPKKEGLHLIEMGCGGSIWLPYFAKEFGYKVSGIDYSEKGCVQARGILEMASCRGEVHCLDFLDLNLQFYHRYDALLSLGVIEHFDKPVEVIGAFTMCLNKDGVIITLVPNSTGALGVIQKIVAPAAHDKMHKRFNLGRMIKYHEANGLTIVYAGYFIGDFVIINLSEFSMRTRKLMGRLITLLNLVPLWACRSTGLNPQIPFLASSMVVIARKATDL